MSWVFSFEASGDCYRIFNGLKSRYVNEEIHYALQLIAFVTVFVL